MKTTCILAMAFLFSLNFQAQNVNVQETNKTTVTTVKNSEGDKKFTKNEKIREVQNIELNEVKPNTRNTDMKESPTTTSDGKENPVGKTGYNSRDNQSSETWRYGSQSVPYYEQQH